MDLLRMLDGVSIVEQHGDPTPPTGIAFDSRKVQRGDVFVCIPGYREDGHDYAEQAAQAGASALIVERRLALDVPQIVVEDGHQALGYLAARWYGVPGKDLGLIGVTGTNGKTTVTYMVEAIFRAAGERVGRIGTVTISDGATERPASHTTPDPLSLQATLRHMKDQGVRWVAMEVSSHALAQQRVIGCPFDYGILTNVTRDHFDYHKNFWKYVQAKAMLFAPRQGPSGDESTRTALVHTRYAWVTSARFTGAAGLGVHRFLRYGTRPEDDFYADDIESTERDTRFVLKGKDVSLPLTLRVRGPFNVENAVAAAAVALDVGIDEASIQSALADFEAVPGRVQEIDLGQPYTVLVDFAHNPAGLKAVLSIPLRRPGTKRIIVFGAEGDKDPGKRPLMGRVVSDMADFAIITSDNPHGEDPEQIAKEVEKGWRSGGCPHQVIVDREEAILAALLQAGPGDLVIIAGKGHETALVSRSGSQPFSDVDVATRLVRELQRTVKASRRTDGR